MIQLEIFTGQNCMGIPKKASALLVLHRLHRHSLRRHSQSNLRSPRFLYLLVLDASTQERVD